MVALPNTSTEDNGEERLIELKERGPWGFRLSGGAEFGCPLQVAKVRVNSKAYYAGLEEDDILIRVNGSDVSLTTHANAMSIVEHGGDNLTLTVLRGVHSLDDLYRKFVETYQQKQHELNMARARLTQSRESSSRTQHVLRRSGSREGLAGAGRATTLLTVSSPNSHQAEYKTFTSSSEDRDAVIDSRQTSRPPLSPGPKPTTSSTLLTIAPPQPSTAQVTEASRLQAGCAPLSPRIEPQVDGSQIQQNFTFTPKYMRKRSNSQPVVVPINAMGVPKPYKEVVEFRVRTVSAPKEVWEPSINQSTLSYNQMGEVTSYPPNPYTQVTATDSEREKRYKKPPANFYWELMENQPEHKPGYNDPLIVDDTQGDFGGNPIIHPGKKLYSDSSFYRTEDNLYPTITEQMRLAKLISGNLEAPDAMRSRGGKMYFKRKQKAGEWTKEAMGRKLEHEYSGGGPDFYDWNGNHHWPSRMKENITHDELERLEHNTVHLSKHDLLPPVVAFDINSALKRSKNHGKGVEIFAKNRDIADQHTVDETNRQRVSHSNVLDSQVDKLEEVTKNYKSPWNAAWEGNLDRAFAAVDPCAAQSCKDEPHLRKDENRHQLNYDHKKASFGVKYKDIAPVPAPSGPDSLKRSLSQSTPALNVLESPKAQPRLARMIAPREEENTTFDTYTYKWCMPSYYGRDLLSASVDERMQKSQYGSAGWYRRPAEFTQPLMHSAASGSLHNVNLLRPKEYLKPYHHSSPDDEVFEEPAPRARLSSFGGSMTNLRRPKDFIDPSLCAESMSQSYNYLAAATPPPQSYNNFSPSQSQSAHITAF